MKINLITNIKDLRIKHLKVFEILKDEELPILKRIEVVSIYTGKAVKDLREVKVSDLDKIFNRIIKTISKYKAKEIPLILEIDRKEFELVQDFSKLPTGWFIDSSVVDFEKTPELLPAFCYIEKGMSYAEKDKHENILNPLKNRAELFKEHLPLTTFLDLSAFFLLKQKLLNQYCKLEKELNPSLNKRLLNGSL